MQLQSSEPVERRAPLRRGGAVSAGPSGALIVERARGVVITHITRRLDAETLARATLVSESSLRRVILAETGLQLSVFVLNIRLDLAHAWLSSNRDTRSQRQIALALGFSSAPAIARAYRRRFGESMATTRCDAMKRCEIESSAVRKNRKDDDPGQV